MKLTSCLLKSDEMWKIVSSACINVANCVRTSLLAGEFTIVLIVVVVVVVAATVTMVNLATRVCRMWPRL